ncbi:hypothetical protein K435DRAFT_112286 [Dendrothele bispora CBS 962.96]|uniref:DUF6533 domain-containing protein n=1 Tax=Dendrothele bispora (strain CBS 962.96) TaxID=1314807 RepID=A0A4S8M1V9_DENBC|nr:hypothetical protein K435DRAFT_112286 [Dendrothele bispora CBS 962.96]
MLSNVLISTSSAEVLAESGWSASAQNVSRSFVASLAFLLYDILLTVDEEVGALWKRNWSLFKFLYFYVRYVPLILQIPLVLVGSEVTPRFGFTEKDCYRWQVYQGVVAIAIFAPSDYILVARIYALYHTTPAIQILVFIAYIATIILMSVGLALSLPQLKYDEICHTTSVPKTLLINGGAEVAFQTLLFLLTMYKFIRSLHLDRWSISRFCARSFEGVIGRGGGGGGGGNTTEGGGGESILKTIVRDGTWAFFVLFSLVSAQALIYLADKEGGILFGWVLSSFSFCSYRILLNLNHVPRSNSYISTALFSSHSYSQSSQSRTYNSNSTTNANRGNRRTTTGTGTGAGVTRLSQWTEHILPVSFDEWGDGYGPGCDFDDNDGGGGDDVRDGYELAPMNSPVPTPAPTPVRVRTPAPRETLVTSRLEEEEQEGEEEQGF